METTTKLYVFLIYSVLGCYFLNRLQNHLSLYSSYYQGPVTVSQPLQTQNQSTWTSASSGSHVEDSMEREIHDTSSLIHPKAFRSWQQRFGNNDTPLPCIIDHEKGDWNPFDNYIQHQPTMEGFLFVKIEKAASSTLAGIAARMSVKIGQRLTKDQPNITRWYDPHTQQWHTAPGICRTRMSHLWSTKGPQVFIPGKRNPQKSFLWTFFKEPSRRALSEFFYFFVDLAPQHKRQSTDDATILEYLMRSRGSQIRKIVPQSWATPPQWWTGEEGHNDSTKTKTTITKTVTPSDAIAAWLEDGKAAKMNVSAIMQSSSYELYRKKVTDYVQSALDQMDFLGIVERMDESLVLLQWILDLSPGDVMAINAKSAGSYHYKRKPKELIGKCVLIPKHTLSPVVKAFIESDEWKYVWNLADYMMYEAIHKSLNHTIDTAMGREFFPAALAEFQKARTMVEDYCSPPNITLQCSPNGTAAWPSQRDPCYWGDAGCAYNCLDKLFSR